MSKKIGRNEPCPCGSGLKHKNCCLGQPTASDEAARLISGARERLQTRLEQAPPLDEATRLEMIQSMRDNGADPAYIHAFEKTGLLVFQETMHLLSEEDLERWADAYEEFQPE